MDLTVRLCSAMTPCFSNDPLPAAPLERLDLLSGEVGGALLFLRADTPCEVRLSAAGAPAALFEVHEIPVGLAIPADAKNCTVLRGGRSGLYPDLLTPLAGSLPLAPGKTAAVYVRIPTAGLAPGEHTLRLTAVADGRTEEARLPLRLSAAALPQQTLIHTDWFHADCLATCYGVEVFSEAHWRIMEAFMRNAAEHGVNCILTPLFTPPLDTEVGGERPTVQLVGVTKRGYRYTFDFEKLRRFVDMAKRCGIRYFELSHLFTQWGARHAPKIVAQTAEGEKRIFGWETDSLSRAYRGFLRQFAVALRAFTDEAGITDVCFVHCSDEPGMKDIRRYRACSAIVREFFGCYRHIDAQSDLAFFEKGLIGTPVPEEGSVQKFLGKADPLWTYYCCGQFNNELPNRFFAMPAARNRILGALLYKYDCEGFLHWGFNFYYTQLSKRPVDPFRETDAGGHFPSGDSFIVYPGKNGEPLTSLRQQIFFAGLQDLRALRAAEAAVGRDRTLALLRETMGEITFTSYPMDPARFAALRAGISALLA